MGIDGLGGGSRYGSTSPSSNAGSSASEPTVDVGADVAADMGFGVMDSFDGAGMIDNVMGGVMSAEARQGLMEAQQADKNKGKFDWARGPRTGASRDLFKKEGSKSLFSKSGERTGRQLGKARVDGDPAAADGRFKDWSANSTLFSAGVGGHKTWKSVGGETELPGGVKAKGEVHAGKLWGYGMASAAVDLKTAEVTAGVAGKVEARALGAEGSLATKTLGDDKVVSIKGSAFGKAYVGADLAGDAGLRVNAKEGTAVVGAGVEAFAGAKAAVFARPTLTIAGENISSYSGVSAEAYAGIGFKAKAEAGIEKGRLKAKFELGAALGVGVGVGVSIDINLVGVAKVGKKAAVAVANRAKTAYAGATKAVGSAVDSAQSTVKGAFNSVRSWWGG